MTDVNHDRVIELVKEAGEVLIENYRKKKDVRIKEDQTPVTAIDLKVESFLREELKEMAPSYSIVSEEFQDELKESDYTWVIDPLDGTINYVRHVPVFATMVALCDGEHPVMGIVHFPVQNETFFAEEGKGAFLDGEEIEVSDTPLEEGLGIYTSIFDDSRVWEAVSKTRRIFSERRAFGAAAMNIVKVAEGDAEACIEFGLKPWDFLPPAVIVEEAGGKITDVGGKALDFESESVVATNEVIHSRLLEILGD